MWLITVICTPFNQLLQVHGKHILSCSIDQSVAERYLDNQPSKFIVRKDIALLKHLCYMCLRTTDRLDKKSYFKIFFRVVEEKAIFRLSRYFYIENSFQFYIESSFQNKCVLDSGATTKEEFFQEPVP